MKPFIHLPSLALLCVIFAFTSTGGRAQSILGTWQLVKQTTCLEDEMEQENDTLQPIVDQMKTMSSVTAQIVTFKEKSAGEENTRILNKKKTANSKNFHYKFDGEMLVILDKKSQTITDSYIVDKFTEDSLIISNVARACETKIFLKIKEAQ